MKLPCQHTVAAAISYTCTALFLISPAANRLTIYAVAFVVGAIIMYKALAPVINKKIIDDDIKDGFKPQEKNVHKPNPHPGWHV